LGAVYLSIISFIFQFFNFLLLLILVFIIVALILVFIIVALILVFIIVALISSEMLATQDVVTLPINYVDAIS